MIERLLTKLNSIPADKIAHALGGAVISLVVCSLLLALGVNPAAACVASAIPTSCVAAGKEAYDWLHKARHTPDPYDALATIIGGIVPLIPVFITQWK